MNSNDRINTLRSRLSNSIVVMDGAMGTAIQALNLTSEDFGGLEFEGCNEYLNITRPAIIDNILQDYAEAGAEVLETNSFGSTPLVLAEYGLGEQAFEISEAAARIARRVADERFSRQRTVFVAGSMGPTTRAISVTGGVTWNDLAENYYVQASGLLEGGVDLLLLETSQDTLNVKAALYGIDKLESEIGRPIPVAVQCTIETMGTTLGGQDIEAFYTSIEHRDLLWIGMNCATGPEFMREHLRTLSQISRFPVSVVPNAGLPDEDGIYNQTPELVAHTLKGFMDQGWVNVVGGCCGTTAEHIRMLTHETKSQMARRPVAKRGTVISGLEALSVDDDTRPVLVGERTNVLGSRRFKRLISEGKIEEASEVGRQQVRGGAHVIDVCLQDPDRDEKSDLVAILEQMIRKVRVPVVIDTTDVTVLEEALKWTPGKSIINSINLEDGEKRFEEVVPLALKFGAALIVGCIDEDKVQAQAITSQRKLEIAQRSFKLLTEKFGVQPENIIFDPLVFPVGTGDKAYIGSGLETIDGVRLIKEHLPDTKTILGISNVSFGLPAAGREVLNAVMLYHCVQSGLDLAIVNTERLERYPSIPEEERRLAEDLIWWRGEDPIGSFANHFRERKVTYSVKDRLDIPLEERISAYIVDGTRDGLIEDLNTALATNTPLEIINGPLMAGMDEVGRLFGRNELIVAEVLGSAESMKAAVTHLEPYMDKDDISNRGTVLLATVKGDVHDIGKNLVDIILTNNGFRVVNLGIKVAPNELISAYREHTPDIIGLSGLLVKSAQMMVETVRDLKEADISCPVLVGGAALTNRFTGLRIAPEYDGLVAYSKDAMSGLGLSNRICAPEEKEKLISELLEDRLILTADQVARDIAQSALRNDTPPQSNVKPVDLAPSPPDLKMHVLKDYDLARVFEFINPVMLYVRHLGFRGRFEEALMSGDSKALDLQEKVRSVESEMISNKPITASGMFKFFRAGSEGDAVVFLSPDGKRELERFRFGRQSLGEGLGLADYVLPVSEEKPDYLAAFVTTIGPGVEELAACWQANGDYLAAHILRILALEGAEAFAELLHQRIRSMWGFSDTPDIEKKELFRTNYRGRRFSFGYPACPRLEDQGKLWGLLNPDRHIGVHLTDGYMMDPEGSVSAIVFHHPQAKYFNLSAKDADILEATI
ncbi:methionine synthase [SAR202 cluster bacterium AD-804-J14_MRT_500m]|nr:methionine synthase [SAR202 cluster bacterium AD-804-J14_MRT_500m]